MTPEEVLAILPQQPPFRFLDRLLHVDEQGASGEYTFRDDEFFYRGHFPGNPLTPGVILLETMCQTGLVALGIYLLSLEAPRSELSQTLTLFTHADVEFQLPVRPGDTLRIQAEKLVWRRRMLRSQVLLQQGDGSVVASGTVSGMGVRRG